MTVDARGEVHDGDFVLALAARHCARHGKLEPKVVVGTVMSNGGLEATLAREGIQLARTKVGDRYVWEEMQRTGALFGGEPSGHVIFRNDHTTGDEIGRASCRGGEGIAAAGAARDNDKHAERTVEQPRH